MSFVYKLLSGEFDFIIPISYIIFGGVVAIIVFWVRYSTYMKRKKQYAKFQESAVDKEFLNSKG